MSNEGNKFSAQVVAVADRMASLYVREQAGEDVSDEIFAPLEGEEKEVENVPDA